MNHFARYQGQELTFWKTHHRRYGPSILAVGRGNATPEINQREYAAAKAQFVKMVRDDFGPAALSELAVIDFGFGHGHYARACHELGFGIYRGLDFASEHHPKIPGYVFEKADISKHRVPERRYDLVLCIDTLFHVVDDSKFEQAIANIRQHAGPKSQIYITSLFVERIIEPYVKHRPVEAFEPLKLVSMDKWRDNKIARFRLP